MKKITYSCNLCDNEEDIDKVIALKSVGMCLNHPDSSKRTIELNGTKKDIEGSRYHICITYADIIHEYRRKISNE